MVYFEIESVYLEYNLWVDKLTAHAVSKNTDLYNKYHPLWATKYFPVCVL